MRVPESTSSSVREPVRSLYVLTFALLLLSLTLCLKVYPIHRLFCGENANPFTFPPLSSVEVTEGKQHLLTVYTPVNAADETSLTVRLCSIGYEKAEVTPGRPVPPSNSPFFADYPFRRP
jgi:hypothetical protein